MHEIFKTPLAQADLKEIWHFTYNTWGEEQADNYLMQLDIGIRQLSENPKLGKPCDDIRRNYRSIHINRHVAYYIVHDGIIEIIRILHARMDAWQHINLL